MAPFTAPEGRKRRKETLARPRETMSETLESLRETMRGTLESLLYALRRRFAARFERRGARGGSSRETLRANVLGNNTKRRCAALRSALRELPGNAARQRIGKQY